MERGVGTLYGGGGHRVLKVKDENRRIRIHWSEARIRVRRLKCDGSTTLLHFHMILTVFVLGGPAWRDSW